MASTVWWSTIYLGNLAEMDTDESDNAIETSAPILTTFGGAGDPLAAHIVDVKSYSPEADTRIYIDNGGTSDTVEYDLGAGTVTTKVDTNLFVRGIVTFYDGSTYEADFDVFQTETGDTFLAVHDTQPALASAGIKTVTFSSIVNSGTSWVEQTNKDDFDFVCFGPGTRIETPLGPRRIDKLRVGDLVTTLDDGPQPIRWIAKRRRLFAPPARGQPVRIAAGALGEDLPRRALLLSPNHRVLVHTASTFALHDPLGALAPAKALTRLPGIREAKGRRAITYFSLLLPLHSVIIAEGIAAESLYPGRQSWTVLTGPERSTWIRLAAENRVTGAPPARLLLSTAEARAGLESGSLWLPDAPPRVLPWSARRRRPRVLPVHLSAR